MLTGKLTRLKLTQSLHVAGSQGFANHVAQSEELIHQQSFLVSFDWRWHFGSTNVEALSTLRFC